MKERERNGGKTAVQWGAWFETEALLSLNSKTMQRNEDLLEHVNACKHVFVFNMRT